MSPRSNLKYPGGLKQYIRDRVIITEATGCWIWQKAVDGMGFPKCRVKKAYWGVNRLAYTLWVGEIPEGKTVRQSCLNKLCCNPEHLLIAGIGRLEGLDFVPLKDRTECKNGHPWPKFLTMRKKGEKAYPFCLKCSSEYQNARNARLRLHEQMFRMVA